MPRKNRRRSSTRSHTGRQQMTALVPIANKSQCSGMTRNGHRCKNPAHYHGHCATHYRQNPAAIRKLGRAVGSVAKKTSAGIVKGAKYAGRKSYKAGAIGKAKASVTIANQRIKSLQKCAKELDVSKSQLEATKEMKKARRAVSDAEAKLAKTRKDVAHLNPRKPINPQSKRWTFATFSKKYFGKDYLDVPTRIRKEFWSDFQYAFVGSLTRYIQKTTEPYLNPRRRSNSSYNFVSTHSNAAQRKKYVASMKRKVSSIHKKIMDMGDYEKIADEIDRLDFFAYDRYIDDKEVMKAKKDLRKLNEALKKARFEASQERLLGEYHKKRKATHRGREEYKPRRFLNPRRRNSKTVNLYLLDRFGELYQEEFSPDTTVYRMVRRQPVAITAREAKKLAKSKGEVFYESAAALRSSLRRDQQEDEEWFDSRWSANPLKGRGISNPRRRSNSDPNLSSQKELKELVLYLVGETNDTYGVLPTARNLNKIVEYNDYPQTVFFWFKFSLDNLIENLADASEGSRLKMLYTAEDLEEILSDRNGIDQLKKLLPANSKRNPLKGRGISKLRNRKKFTTKDFYIDKQDGLYYLYVQLSPDMIELAGRFRLKKDAEKEARRIRSGGSMLNPRRRRK